MLHLAKNDTFLNGEGSLAMYLVAIYPFTGGEMTDVGPSFILHACSVLKCMYTTKNKMTARNNICFPWDQ